MGSGSSKSPACPAPSPTVVGFTYETKFPKVTQYMNATNELIKALVTQNFCTHLDEVLLAIDNMMEQVKTNNPDKMILPAVDIKRQLNAGNIASKQGIDVNNPSTRQLLSQQNQDIFNNYINKLVDLNTGPSGNVNVIDVFIEIKMVIASLCPGGQNGVQQPDVVYKMEQPGVVYPMQQPGVVYPMQQLNVLEPNTISTFGNIGGGNSWMIVLLIIMILIVVGMFLAKKKFSFGRRR